MRPSGWRESIQRSRCGSCRKASLKKTALLPNEDPVGSSGDGGIATGGAPVGIQHALPHGCCAPENEPQPVSAVRLSILPHPPLSWFKHTGGRSDVRPSANAPDPYDDARGHAWCPASALGEGPGSELRRPLGITVVGGLFV